MGGDTGDTHNDDKTHLGIPSVTSCSQGAGTFPGQSQADPQRGTIPAWGRGAEEVWSPRPGGGGNPAWAVPSSMPWLCGAGASPPPPTPQGGGISCLMALDGPFFQELAAESFLILISFFFFLFLSSCKHSLALGHGGCEWGGGAALGRA